MKNDTRPSLARRRPQSRERALGAPEPPAKWAQPQASRARARATSRRTNQETQPPGAGGTVTAPPARPAPWGPASPAGGAESAPPARWAHPAGRPLPRRVRSAPPEFAREGVRGGRRGNPAECGSAFRALLSSEGGSLPAGALGRIPRRSPFAPRGPASGRRCSGGAAERRVSPRGDRSRTAGP